jgi:hypothetical protein
MLIPRASVLIAMAIGAALAVGLPLGWGLSQFHRSSQLTHREMSSHATQSGPTYVVREAETYLDKLADPVTIATLILCGITGALAWYTRGLFGETSRIAKDTKISSERQLRAYPGITGADIRFLSNTVSVRLKVQNFSTTPAYKFRYAIVAEVCERRVIDGFKKPVERRSVWDMAPHSTTTMKCYCSVSGPDERTSVIGADKVIIISGRADYEDAFCNKRWIKFRYRTILFRTEKVQRLTPDGTLREMIESVCTEPEAIDYDSN